MSGIRRLRYLTAGAALLLLVVFVNPPGHSTFVYVLHKSAHPVVFALIALIYLKLAEATNNWWKPYLRAFLVVLACGVVTELAQFWIGRSPSALDVLRDATGGIAGLALALLTQRWNFMPRGLRARLVLIATAATSAAVMPLVWCVAAYANRDFLFPIIWEYRSPLDVYFLKVWTGNVSGVNLPTEWAVRPKEKAIEISFENEAPNIAIYEPFPDWRGYSALSLDMTNPNPSPLDLVVRVNSESPNWYDYQIQLKPRERATLRLPLDTFRSARSDRDVNMSEVAGMAVAAPNRLASGKFYVNRISLE